MVSTVVWCGHCKGQAGRAARSVAGVTLDTRFRLGGGKWWSSSATETPLSLVVDLDVAGDWPVRWTCPHCAAQLELDRDEARQVARRRNLTVHSPE